MDGECFASVCYGKWGVSFWCCIQSWSWRRWSCTLRRRSIASMSQTYILIGDHCTSSSETGRLWLSSVVLIQILFGSATPKMRINPCSKHPDIPPSDKPWSLGCSRERKWRFWLEEPTTPNNSQQEQMRKNVILIQHVGNEKHDLIQRKGRTKFRRYELREG